MPKPKEISWIINEKSCWICISHKGDRDGYPQKKVKSKSTRISRIMYEKYKGKIPEGLFVLHHCDNPSCINPDHLFFGTAKDNSVDMIKKGRGVFVGGAKGEKNHSAKLTKDKVCEIMVASGTIRFLAKLYGVSHTTIWSIKNRITWKHVLVDNAVQNTVDAAVGV